MSEADIFFDENPDIKNFDILNYDLCGVMRGKRVQRDLLSKLFDFGMQLPASILLMDVTGESDDPDGRGFTDGDPDSILTPIPGTLRRVPWANDPLGQVLTTFYEEDGRATIDDPRHVLAKVVEAFYDCKLQPVVACELEFYLIDKQRTDGGAPIPPIMPKSNIRMNSTQVFSISEINEFSSFFNDISEACSVQSIPIGPISMEYSAGQMEVNLSHINDPVRACDQSVMLQRIIRGVAISHGYEATFMAKPYLDGTGSGLHVHCSILDGQNQNIFDDGSSIGAANLRHAIGGMLASMDESMAIFAPNINSYRRFVPDSFVPMFPSWSPNNRSTAIRIPAGTHDSRRFEHRVAGADANPYLTMAAVLAGAHFGIINKLEPPPMVEGAAPLIDNSQTPLSLRDALHAMKNEAILSNYISKSYLKRYRLTKTLELKRFKSIISRREYEWYLLSR